MNLVSKSAGLAFESCLSETGPTRGGGTRGAVHPIRARENKSTYAQFFCNQAQIVSASQLPV